MSTTFTLYVGNSTRMELKGLSSHHSMNRLANVNDATVTVTVVDDLEAEVSGQSWPLTMDYEAESSGDYSAVISYALAVSEGDELTAKVTATDGANVGYWEVPIIVAVREE